MLNDSKEDATEATTPAAEVKNIAEFLGTPLHQHVTVNETPISDIKPPKAGQNYWLSPEAKKRKSEYMKVYNAKKKQELNDYIQKLKDNSLKPCVITFYDDINRPTYRKLESSEDYFNFIEDIMTVLVNKGLVSNYDVRT